MSRQQDHHTARIIYDTYQKRVVALKSTRRIHPRAVGIKVIRNVATGQKTYLPYLAGVSLRVAFPTRSMALQYGRAVADRYIRKKKVQNG